MQGKVTVSDTSRQFDLAPSEIEEWVEQGKAGMKNAPRAKPEGTREPYRRRLRNLQQAYGYAMLELKARQNSIPAGQGRAMIEAIRQGLKADRFEVSIGKLYRWFGVARRSV